VSPALALLVLLLVSVLGLPGVTRIPVVGSWAANVTRTLLETVGDSRAFVQNEIDAVQMTKTVRSDLDILAARCRKVAVVAHSQGAAVAHAALRQREDEGKAPVDLLLTFGSGLRKLHELSAPERVAPLGYALGYLAVSGMLLALLGLLNLLPWFGWTRTLVGAGGLVMFLAGLGPILKLVAAESPFLSGEVRNSKAWATWEDLYATHDPVPNGRLFLVKDSPLGSRKVDNRASVWTDHTTYWDNFDHFVGMVVGELTRQSSLDPSTEPRLRDSVSQALDRREWRVRWLQAGRWILLALWIAACWHALAVSAAFAIPAIGGHRSMSIALGITVCTVAAGLAYATAAWMWRRWDDADTAKLFRREPYERYTLPFLCFACIVGGTLGIGLWFQTWAGATAAAGRLPVSAAGGLAFGLICALCSPVLSRKTSRVRDQQMQRRGAVAPRNR
jgi:hypothetical protein